MAKTLRQTIQWVFETTGALTAMQNMQRGVKQMQTQFKDLSKVVAAAFAVNQVKQFALESSQLAAQMEGVKQAFATRFDSQMFDQIRAATRGTVDDLQLMKNAVKAEQLGLPMQHFAEMLAFAQQRARETGESVEGLVEQLVLGIGRQSVMRLDDLGLNAKRVNDEFKKTGDFAGATAKIIQEEMAKASKITGGFAEVSENVNAKITNMKLAFGSLINKALTPLVNMADKILAWFSGLDEGIQTVVLIMGALVVAIPVAVVGIGALSAAFGTLSAASLPITGTILAIVAAIAVLAAAGNYIYQNWEPISRWFANLWVKMKNAMITAVAYMVEKSVKWLELFGVETEKIGEAIRGFKEELPYKEEEIQFKSFGQTITDTVGSLKPIFDDLTGATKNAGDAVGELPKEVADYMARVESMKPELAELHNELWDELILGKGKKMQFDPYSNVQIDVGLADDVDDGDLFAEQFVPEKGMQKIGERLIELRERFKNFASDVSNAIQTGAVNFTIGMAEMIGAAAAGSASMADMGKFVLESFAGMLHQLGVIAIQTGIAVGAIKKALQTLNPFVAVAAGVALVALAAAVKGKLSNLGAGNGSGAGQSWGGQQRVPGLATGGVVTAPTLAVVGEGRESEAILPLSKLESLINTGGGGGVFIPDVRISGNDLLLVFERAQNKRASYYGR